MCTAFRLLVSFLLLSGCTSQTIPGDQAGPAEGSEVGQRYSPEGDIQFSSVLELGQEKTGLLPQLRGGWVVANSTDWPASLYAKYSARGRTFVCTATLIGPQVLLTAGHCVPARGAVRFRFAGKDYSTSTCATHPRYALDESADFGLCKLSESVREPAGFRYETVDTTALSAMQSQSLLLTGYGCKSDRVSDESIDGRFRVGFNVVNETSLSTTRSRNQVFYKGFQENNLITTDDAQMANLCPSDSGGATYRLLAGTSNLESRVMAGVNSRVFYKDSTRKFWGASLISSVGGPDFRSWAERWARDDAKVPACGIAGVIPNCRT